MPKRFMILFHGIIHAFVSHKSTNPGIIGKKNRNCFARHTWIDAICIGRISWSQYGQVSDNDVAVRKK